MAARIFVLFLLSKANLFSRNLFDQRDYYFKIIKDWQIFWSAGVYFRAGVQ